MSKEVSKVKVYRFNGDFVIPKAIVDRINESREYTWERKCANQIQSAYVNDELERRIREEGLTPEIMEVGAPNIVNVNKLPLTTRSKEPQRDWMRHK